MLSQCGFIKHVPRTVREETRMIIASEVERRTGGPRDEVQRYFRKSHRSDSSTGDFGAQPYPTIRDLNC